MQFGFLVLIIFKKLCLNFFLCSVPQSELPTEEFKSEGKKSTVHLNCKLSEINRIRNINLDKVQEKKYSILIIEFFGVKTGGMTVLES